MRERPWQVVLDVSAQPEYVHHASCATEESARESVARLVEGLAEFEAKLPRWRVKMIGIRGPFGDGKVFERVWERPKEESDGDS